MVSLPNKLLSFFNVTLIYYKILSIENEVNSGHFSALKYLRYPLHIS